MNAEFWQRWLVMVTLATGAFGIAMVLAPQTIEWLFDTMMAPARHIDAPVDAETKRYTRFVYGVLGAVMAGWSLLLLSIVQGPLARYEPWAWLALVRSLSSWFLIDPAWSVATGFWPNAVLNVGMAALYLPALVAIRGHFRPRP